MAIDFHQAPGVSTAKNTDVFQPAFAFLEKHGIPQETALAFGLILLFLLAVFFFRPGSFGSGGR
jgi:hypothetical protein